MFRVVVSPCARVEAMYRGSEVGTAIFIFHIQTAAILMYNNSPIV